MLLLLDKPKGMTSHDVVDVVRKVVREQRVGHAGTLDPNATGLLIVAVGREDTKKLGELTKNTKKTYIAEIVLGEERDTDDVDGRILRKKEIGRLKKMEIEHALDSFLGPQYQTPPIYSAIKINGKKAYELARSGKVPELKPREIEVFDIELLEYKFPKVNVRFTVSAGTYIRSLARDIGRKLGTFAYLANLRRTKIGEYDVKNAQTLQEFSEGK